MDWKEELLKAIIPLCTAAISTVGLWALGKLAVWLDAKAKESKLANALAILPHMAEAIWKDVSEELKHATDEAAADGKITKEEADAIRAQALVSLKAALKKHGLSALAASAGPLVDNILKGALSVAEQKAAASLPK